MELDRGLLSDPQSLPRRLTSEKSVAAKTALGGPTCWAFTTQNLDADPLVCSLISQRDESWLATGVALDGISSQRDEFADAQAGTGQHQYHFAEPLQFPVDSTMFEHGHYLVV